MPLPNNQQAVETAKELISTTKGAFGTPPGFRPLHAKGIMATGTFVPTSDASALSSAHHFNAASTPITVRFSSSTGIPQIPDTDANSNPRGFAIRFHYPNDQATGRRVHTDIVTHSIPFFPTRTGEEFLEMLKALGASANSTEKPTPIEKFLGSHPGALAFVQAPKPWPESLGTEMYWGVTAFKLVKNGNGTFVRYKIVPEAGIHHLSEEAVKAKSANYLYEELPSRIASGPIGFKMFAQIAEDGDVTDDATVHWPDDRKVVELGSFKLDKVVEESAQAAEQKQIIFDPIPRVEGLEPSADPLLDVRAAVYLMSGKERRAA